MIGFASKICKTIDLYGFNVSALPYHYYTVIVAFTQIYNSECLFYDQALLFEKRCVAQPNDMLEWISDKGFRALWEKKEMQNRCIVVNTSRRNHGWVTVSHLDEKQDTLDSDVRMLAATSNKSIRL